MTIFIYKTYNLSVVFAIFGYYLYVNNNNTFVFCKLFFYIILFNREVFMFGDRIKTLRIWKIKNKQESHIFLANDIPVYFYVLFIFSELCLLLKPQSHTHIRP